uniref:NR LBD domain-containing protein n=1 Tax=Acrobeloides nanus TaxID=290746 RepID=A0A914E7T0_9BILA
MKELQLTQDELTFLLAQIIWNVQEVEGLSEEVVKLSEQINEQIGMDLHNYYVHERGISIFASRLIKLTKLVEAARDIIRSKSELFLMEKIFDSVEFSITIAHT